jgi:hypothetical protein
MSAIWWFEIVLLFWVVVGGGVGMLIGAQIGRESEGCWFGLLLGFIGWIIVALMGPSDTERASRQAEAINPAARMSSPSTTEGSASRSCPWCAEDIKAAARLCRYCGRDVEPAADEQRTHANADE